MILGFEEQRKDEISKVNEKYDQKIRVIKGLVEDIKKSTKRVSSGIDFSPHGNASSTNEESKECEEYDDRNSSMVIQHGVEEAENESETSNTWMLSLYSKRNLEDPPQKTQRRKGHNDEIAEEKQKTRNKKNNQNKLLISEF